MNHFPVYLKNERYGVAMRFRTVEDRDRYLNDKYTSGGFEPCTEHEANEFIDEIDSVWTLPTSFYAGTLDGLEVIFSCDKVFAGVYEEVA